MKEEGRNERTGWFKPGFDERLERGTRRCVRIWNP